MKKLVTVVLCLVLCMSLAACGGSEKESAKGKNIITGYKNGDVTLGQYVGITYKPYSTEVTDEEVEKKFQAYLESCKEKVEVTDRYEIRKGDFVDVDFVGKKDGVAFEGGTGSKEELEIGSNTFIADFENGLIGKKNGTSFTIDVTFPEGYKNADLAGKPATFDITVKKIKEWRVPEATDEFIIEKTSGEFATVDAYKANIKSQLRAEKEQEAQLQKENEVVQKLIENTTYNIDMEPEIQKGFESIKTYYDTMINGMYGMDAATFYGVSAEEFDKILRNQATISVKFEYARSAIAEAERFTVTDEEIDKLTQDQMDQYGFTTIEEFYQKIAENFDGVSGRDYITELIKLDKAEELIFSSAVQEAGSGSGEGTQK